MHISTLAISYLSAVLSLRDTGLEHERRLIKPFGTLPSVINELCYVSGITAFRLCIKRGTMSDSDSEEDLSPYGILRRVRENDPTLTVVFCPDFKDYCRAENLDKDEDGAWLAYMNYSIELCVAFRVNTNVKSLILSLLLLFDNDERKLQFFRDALAPLIHVNNAIRHIEFPVRTGNDGLALVAPSLQENTTIETLGLSYNDIEGQEGGAIIREILVPNRSITKLNIRGNENFGAPGVTALALAFDHRLL